MFNLEAMKNVDIEHVDRNDLVAIESVSVGDRFKDIDRIVEFIRQIGNPYCFISGKYIIKASYSDNGPPFEDCVQGIFL